MYSSRVEQDEPKIRDRVQRRSETSKGRDQPYSSMVSLISTDNHDSSMVVAQYSSSASLVISFDSKEAF